MYNVSFGYRSFAFHKQISMYNSPKEELSNHCLLLRVRVSSINEKKCLIDISSYTDNEPDLKDSQL